MKNRASLKCWFQPLAAALMAGAFLCSCASALQPPEDDSPERDKVTLAVLAHMVTNTDASGSLVRFVDLPENRLRDLRATCGQRYAIFPTNSAVLTSAASETRNTSPNERASYRLRGTSREGDILTVTIGKIHRSRAEAYGAYKSGNSVVAMRYTLARSSGRWYVRSAATRFVS